MEVNCWLPIMPETDLPNSFPNLTALPVLTSSGRVQLWMPNMASMATADLPMLEWRSTVSQIYEYNSLNAHDESRLNEEKKSATNDSYIASPPVDVLAEHIPPKPPYLTCPNMTTKWLEKAFPHLNDWWGHSSEEQSTFLLIPHGPTPAPLTRLMYGNNLSVNSLQNQTTSLATPHGWATSPAAKAFPKTRIKWEIMRSFHSQSKEWPLTDDYHSTKKDGRSPLNQTMFQALLADDRLKTYAWQGFPANDMPLLEGQSYCRTARPPHLSHAMWNHCLGYLSNGDKFHRHNCCYMETSTQLMQQLSQESRQNETASSDKQQWDHQQAFYSSF